MIKVKNLCQWKRKFQTQKIANAKNLINSMEKALGVRLKGKLFHINLV